MGAAQHPVTTNAPALFLLGGIDLRGVSHEVAHALLTQSKVVGLVAYLALAAPGTFQRRDRVAAMLWPELDQAHARQALRKAVHETRGALGDGAIVNRGDEEFALAGSLWCDAVALRDAVAAGRLALAVELHRDELMPGFHLPECYEYHEWLDDRRTELRELAVRASLDLATTLATEHGTRSADYARKAVRLAGFNERVLRRAMLVLDRIGDRAGALQLYDDFAARLREQLEAAPSPDSQRLADSLRAGRPPA